MLTTRSAIWYIVSVEIHTYPHLYGPFAPAHQVFVDNFVKKGLVSAG
jgi:hypothetical protein